MGISEGVVLEWLKSAGDHVSEDEPIVEIETAKATDVVRAPTSGTLAEILAQTGETIPVGDLIATIETEPR
jgi:pyruvate/2-oxoglutarate dehydrogenase complex dihydrolipoamide acyltransferase (E2) component